MADQDQKTRSQKLSALYPQPIAGEGVQKYRRNYIQKKPETVELQPLRASSIVLVGILMPIPFIIFDIVMSLYSTASNLTDALGVSMLMTLFLLFLVVVFRIVYFACRYFTRDYLSNFASFYFVAWLFFIGIFFGLRNLLPKVNEHAFYPMLQWPVIYYAAILCISLTAVKLFVRISFKNVQK